VIGRPKTECEPHRHQQLREQCRSQLSNNAHRSAAPAFPPKPHDVIVRPSSDCFSPHFNNGPIRDAVDFPTGNDRHLLDRTSDDVPSPEPDDRLPEEAEPPPPLPPLIGRRFPPSFSSDLQCRQPLLLAEGGLIVCGDSPSCRSNCLHLLHERRLSSDYDVTRSLGGASDLEVNMESEADVQALNASEEDVVCTDRPHRAACMEDSLRGHDDRRRRRRRASRDNNWQLNDDSSETESDSSETSTGGYDQHQSNSIA